MLTIRLLGRPVIERDDVAVRQPRGRKAWALLGYLLLTGRPQTRRHLAELLFADADDPLGALRWTLAELRRTLGLPGALTGDPVSVSLAGEAVVDVDLITRDDADSSPLLQADGDLLERVSLAGGSGFESWLLVERHRLSARIEARCRQVAVGLLAAGRAGDAVAYAARAVARNPLEEGNHELLVRSLASSGDRAAALRQVAVCEDILRRELGLKPSAVLYEATSVTTGRPVAPALSGRAAGSSQLDAGRAAIAAGAVDAGLQCLRRAVAEAARHGDTGLQGRALVALGSALIHAARGRDSEGSIAMHEAIALTERTGDRAMAARAYRELGFVEVQAGRRDTADEWLRKAQSAAETDAEFAALFGLRGMSSSDVGDYPAAFGYLNESVERAARCQDHRQQAWSLSILARAHLLRAEHGEAAAALRRSLDLTSRQRWMAFLPWPQTLQAELDLHAERLEEAGDALEHAWELACQLGDPCWEAMSARGLGLLNATRADYATAVKWQDEATFRCVRVPDRYQWIHAYALDAAVTTALKHEDRDRAIALVDPLATLAAHCDMREFVVRAQLHRWRLGDSAALGNARRLGEGIDNPALAELFR
ncbi:hypothetical protein Aph01nite_04070 [Acrocarpospora phusangensis]|uniref:Bacterial transcriptional activator domain-containing protein n=1 Tax=Acrocarpospora phusangensis TaxID=1070424 RepID=A0A919ULE4_9ACTN|nr:tetratricopeptide repeat protein [Acrocarpospora phusangensis]GIH22097.1 hypothetical protein Aph01nite_04070 [Acrocarpospora phusangensis]